MILFISSACPPVRSFPSYIWYLRKILDVLVQAASELAGWTTPVLAESGGTGSGSYPSGTGSGSYPSALMREPRGTTHRSARLQQRRRQAGTDTVKADANTADESGGFDDVADLARAAGGRGQGTGDEEGGGVGIVSEKTKRWGYRRGPREQLRRNLFGRYAPMFFYPLAQVCSCLYLGFMTRCGRA